MRFYAFVCIKQNACGIIRQCLKPPPTPPTSEGQTNSSKFPKSTVTSTWTSDCPGEQRWESRQEFSPSLKLSFSFFTTASVTFGAYERVQHQESLWGETVWKCTTLSHLCVASSLSPSSDSRPWVWPFGTGMNTSAFRQGRSVFYH